MRVVATRMHNLGFQFGVALSNSVTISQIPDRHNKVVMTVQYSRVTPILFLCSGFLDLGYDTPWCIAPPSLAGFCDIFD